MRYNLGMAIARFEKVSKEQFTKDIQANLGFLDVPYDDIVIPKRATSYAAGYDFTCPFDIALEPGEMKKIPTGIRCFMENEYVLNLYPRSSFGFKYQMTLANTTGIIDADYYNALNEGHIIVAIVNNGPKSFSIKKGDRFVQGVFLRYYTAEEDEVVEQRQGGFGSSDKVRL